MKRIFVLAGFAGLLLFPGARAAAQDDQYVQIYNLIQEADALNDSSQATLALTKYVEAQRELEKFRKMYPGWNLRVVNFRLNYLASRISEISGKAPPVSSAAFATVAAPPLPAGAQPAPERSEIENQVSLLQNQVRQLQADKELLAAKLKEALSAQPAAADPRELAKAEEKIRALEKEKGLLQVSLDRQQARVSSSADAQSVEALKRDLAGQTALASRLSQDKEKLQARVRVLEFDVATLVALRSENEVLKKQLASVRKPGSATQSSPDMNRQLAEARAQIAALQSDKEILRLEGITLQNRVRQLSGEAMPAAVAAAVASAEDAARIKQLEIERADLRKKLDAAQKELYGRKRKSVAARIEDLTGQLGALRDRLAVYDAQQVPYSKEELALFKTGQTTVFAAATRKTPQALPAGTATLVAEARRDFAAKRFDRAEEKYLQVLQEDPNNVYTLANLATIQLELGHLDDAEKHVQQALALGPDDAYSLLVKGEIMFRREKDEEALDALSQAAKLDPQNAEIQNYLGLTLSQKGMRQPAETAFRKAMQLDPHYAGAHYNLGVFYATQKPPWPELARWHYQKALDVGFPRNSDLEKALDQSKADAGAR